MTKMKSEKYKMKNLEGNTGALSSFCILQFAFYIKIPFAIEQTVGN